jgi:starch-binding outer membrane protein, SusD/RagB family
MKKHIILFISLGFCMLFNTACMDKFLDVSPETGISEDVIFTKYENMKKFFDYIYLDRTDASLSTTFKLAWNLSTQKMSFDALTDMSDMGRIQTCQKFKAGVLYPNNTLLDFTDGSFKFGFFNPMWRVIRIANTVLPKIDLLTDATPEQKWDLKGQAFFVRGFCHFELFRSWGPMPHITDANSQVDVWNMVRPTKYQACMDAAADLDSASFYFEKAKMMRRDPGPGIAGHLADPYQYKPNGCAAIAIKARVLLYAASPLNNEGGNIEYWKNAAVANWKAIDVATTNSYALLTLADYKKNYYGVKYSNEQIYGWIGCYTNMQSQFLQAMAPSVFRNSTTSTNSSENPTQNFIDKYETINGEPLATPEDRIAATAAGHYNEQNPYVGLDPRFYKSILYNQAPLQGWGQPATKNAAEIWYQNVNGVLQPSELLNPGYNGVSQTGYYQIKLWGGESYKYNYSSNFYLTCPVIRLAELYLNYAEAANEAYGPTGTAPNASMSAVDAINFIRNHVGMPPVLSKFTTDKDVFRARIKNERTIELAFEGHYYYDIRRWKDAPAVYSSKLMGIYVEKVPVDVKYPTGFKYSRIELPSTRQVSWREAMYYFPYGTDQYDKMTKFVPGEKW